MPVLPVPTRSEILPFEALRGSGEPQGRHFVQNDDGEGMTTGEGDDYRDEMTIEGTVILDIPPLSFWT